MNSHEKICEPADGPGWVAVICAPEVESRSSSAGPAWAGITVVNGLPSPIVPAAHPSDPRVIVLT